MRHKHKQYDTVLFLLSAIILIAGMFMFASSAISQVGEGAQSLFSILLRQFGLGVGLGIIAFLIVSRIQYSVWRKIALPFLLASLALLALVFVPDIGVRAGGASRWVSVGPISFQPAELFKLAFVIYLASWFVSHKNEITSFSRGLLPFLLMMGVVSIFFILQPDIGTLAVIIVSAIVLFFIAGGRLFHLAIAFGITVLLIAGLALSEPYRFERLQVFFKPQSDIQNAGYQIHQSLIAVGSGGFEGKGFGQGVQKFHYIPEPLGDSIFAVVGEEMGFVGGTFLIGLFLAFLWRAIRLLAAVPDRFARLMGSGIVIIIVFQSFVNIGGSIGLIPMTGIPLVFMSQGGTSLAVTLAGMGILFNISRYAKA
ncbi:MAG: cell division protein FtsW [Candidatus Niyogibacteria bacterium]|nr:cell division protein FtsW [Candidatus Niyogibacteria bacterium]